MEKVLFEHKIYHFGYVSFQHLNIFEVRSKARIPENCKTAIAIIFPYYNKNAFGGNISAYCSVQDYHTVIGMQLKSICEDLKTKYPENNFAYFTDSSPVDEVDMCVKAGLGVKGRNSLLITPKFGSYVFIGEILTDREVDNTTCYENKGCLNCGLCERMCPGSAIEKFHINKDLCASNLTQKKGELTDKEEKIIANAHTVFGCDICQLSCPMNRRIEEIDNLFSEDILSTVTEKNVENIYKSRRFGWRGLKVLQRNLEIYNKNKK